MNYFLFSVVENICRKCFFKQLQVTKGFYTFKKKKKVKYYYELTWGLPIVICEKRIWKQNCYINIYLQENCCKVTIFYDNDSTFFIQTILRCILLKPTYGESVQDRVVYSCTVSAASNTSKLVPGFRWQWVCWCYRFNTSFAGWQTFRWSLCQDKTKCYRRLRILQTKWVTSIMCKI